MFKPTTHPSLPILAAIAALAVSAAGRDGAGRTAFAASQASPEQTPSGREIYINDCQPCHGSEGRGDGPAARFLETPPRDLTAGVWMSAKDGSVAELARVITDGVEGTEMEPFGELLTEEEILAVATFVFETMVQPSEGGR